MPPYLIQTPAWLPLLFPKSLIWKMPEEKEPAVYLSFDDGPHPHITAFVLDELKKHEAKASFFCIGKNVAAFPEVHDRILNEGHCIGNHTHNHRNGWKTPDKEYIENIYRAAGHIRSRIFRPPYGRIRNSQVRLLSNEPQPWKIYMWSVLSGDFDPAVSPEKCTQNVLRHIFPGAIVVFHDSEKAFPRLEKALPEVLKFCKEKNWQLKALPS